MGPKHSPSRTKKENGSPSRTQTPIPSSVQEQDSNSKKNVETQKPTNDAENTNVNVYAAKTTTNETSDKSQTNSSNANHNSRQPENESSLTNTSQNPIQNNSQKTEDNSKNTEDDSKNTTKFDANTMGEGNRAAETHQTAAKESTHVQEDEPQESGTKNSTKKSFQPFYIFPLILLVVLVVGTIWSKKDVFENSSRIENCPQLSTRFQENDIFNQLSSPSFASLLENHYTLNEGKPLTVQFVGHFTTENLAWLKRQFLDLSLFPPTSIFVVSAADQDIQKNQWKDVKRLE